MPSWHMRLRCGAAYLGLSFIVHLVWEVAQLPLYTVWTTGTRGEIAFDVLHCTVGDVMIAASSLAVALVVTRARSWPQGDWRAPVCVALMIGVGYTAYSEWHNVYIKHAWSYTNAMPLFQVGTIAIGLSPLLQWIVAPAIAFAILHRTWSKAPHVGPE